MKKLLLSAWCLLPVGAGAFHLGPGQEHLRLDQATDRIEEAERRVALATQVAAADGDVAATIEWKRAEEAYTEALALLPDDAEHARRSVRLERAKCQMFLSELPRANADLVALVEELAEDPDAEPQLVADARRAMASSQYYMTWLMRLEGESREEWEPRIESARQTFKLLAEEAAERGVSSDVKSATEDLESAIRLARMDLTELQGLPLPSQ
jgi:hypothetical protein